MAQTPRCPVDGGPYKPPLGVCAIYSQSTISACSEGDERTVWTVNSNKFKAITMGVVQHCRDEQSTSQINVNRQRMTSGIESWKCFFLGVQRVSPQVPLQDRNNAAAVFLVFPEPHLIEKQGLRA